MAERQTIMAVGAHTGDAQLTCGMLLAKRAMAGDRVVIVDLTAGERGAPRGMDLKAFREVNVQGAQKFAERLGGVSIVLDTPDGELCATQESAVALADIMREYRVNTVLGHWKYSMHKDHVAAFKLTDDAVFFASLNTFERPLPPAPIGQLLYAENWEDAEGFEPYMYYDVSDAFPIWKEAVRNLWLTEHSPYFQYLRHYEALSVVRGTLIQVQHGTAFGVDGYKKRVIVGD